MRQGVLVALLCVAGWVGNAQAAFSDGQVNVVVFTDMTHDMAKAEGPGAELAAEFAVEDDAAANGSLPVDVRGVDHGQSAVEATKRARKLVSDGADLLVGLGGQDVADAVQKAVAGHTVVISTGPVSDDLTGRDCNRTSFHWGPNLYVITQVTRPDLRDSNSSRTIFIYGPGRAEAIRTTYENGMMRGGQDVTGQVFLTDVEQTGLYVTSGMRLITPFYWNRTPQARKWARRFARRQGAYPTYVQAAVYSAVRHYLSAVRAVSSDDPKAVASEMRKTPVSDFYAPHGNVRADGQLVQDVYLMRVKQPSDSHQAWDYFEKIKTLPGDAVYQPLSTSACSLGKQAAAHGDGGQG